jgi:hypothetical protein
MKFRVSTWLALLVPVLVACEGSPGLMTRQAGAVLADAALADAAVAAIDVDRPGLVLPGGDRDADADGEQAATPAEPSAPAVTGSTRFPRPRAIRGLYVNAWAAGSNGRMRSLMDMVLRTEVNALVIDVKDASGFISHHSQVPLVHEIGASQEIRIRDLPGLLALLEEERIYPIARIVIVQDAILAKYRPELAVTDTAGGVWVDSKGITWLNAYEREVWDYHIAIAREVALMGFPEIQFDYVRFPDAPEEDMARAVFGSSNGRTKAAAIREHLDYARRELADLGVQLTVDVFGVTTSANRDVGIGQIWESMIDRVDAALPMVYPSHYWPGSFGFTVPNAYPYEIVLRALNDAQRRSVRVEGAGRTIPWLQDFSLGQPPYAAAEVRAQIQATYDAGIDEWILWNPGSRYTEGALEPVAGFAMEPLIRVGGTLAPVSRRHAVLDSVAAVRAPTAEDGV